MLSSDSSVWTEADTDVDDCGSDCLAVVVGELLANKLSAGCSFFSLAESMAICAVECGPGRMCMLELDGPLKTVPVVKMLDDTSGALYVLGARDGPGQPRICLEPCDIDFWACFGFYDEFVDCSLLATENGRLVKIMDKIDAFCDEYRQEHFADMEDKMTTGAADEPNEESDEEIDDGVPEDVVSQNNLSEEPGIPASLVANGHEDSPEDINESAAAALEESSDAPSSEPNGGAGEMDLRHAASVVIRSSVARLRGADATAAIIEPRAVRSYDIFLAIVACVYFVIMDCFRAVTGRGRTVVVRAGPGGEDEAASPDAN